MIRSGAVKNTTESLGITFLLYVKIQHKVNQLVILNINSL